MFVGKTVLFLVSPNDDVSRQLFHSRQLATVYTLPIFVMPAFQCNRFGAANCLILSLIFLEFDLA